MKKLLAIFTLSFILYPLSFASASELRRTRSELDAARRQDATLGGQIEAGERQVQRTKRDLVRTAGEISRLEFEKAEVTRRIRALESRRQTLLKQIAETTEHLANATASIVVIGQGGANFDARSAGEHAVLMALLGAISEQFDKDMKMAGEQLEELSKLSRDLERQLTTLKTARAKHQREHKSLDSLLSARSSQNQALRGRQHELQQQIGRLSARAQNLSELATGVAPREATGREQRGRMKFPTGGELVTRFRENLRPGFRSDGWYVRARANAVVVAPADGKIEYVNSFRGHRRVVIISHTGGYLTVLTGLESTNVLLGQEVLGGEPIGQMGQGQPEMYVELRRGNAVVDPARRFNEPR